MKKLFIKPVYVLWERFLIKSTITVDDESIAVHLGDVKEKIVSVRSEPSLSNIGKVLSLKLGKEIKIYLKNIKRVRLFKIRRSRRDLSSLFKDELDRSSYAYEVILTYDTSDTSELKLLMNFKNGLKLRRIILRRLKDKKTP